MCMHKQIDPRAPKPDVAKSVTQNNIICFDNKLRGTTRVYLGEKTARASEREEERGQKLIIRVG